jgi:hypothetical protein
MRVAGRPVRVTCNFCVLNAAMRWGRLLGVTALVVFAGCSPIRTGATLDAIFDTGWQAYLDETPMGDLKTGTFVYVDRPPGSHRLYFARPGDLYRASQQEISVLAGRTYYFRLHLNEKGQWIANSQAVAGLTGALLSSAISAAADERGLFDFTPLDEGTARMVMADLHLAQ